ncbi:NlpC/P60 family protein [Pseudooceanicola sp. C21-150M6]|uniref:C40 family peptidase n=1 Tax=Pseudooceanicola sp. C21-150M6 TaxID=3434355 RepID=UPI003D7F5765
MSQVPQDRRALKANGRVADISLDGMVEAERFVVPELLRVVLPVAPLLDRPGGRRERELAFGQGFFVLEQVDGFAFGYAERDGFVGYVAEAALAVMPAPTHRVIAPTYGFPEPGLKCPEPPVILPVGALVSGEVTRFDHCDWLEVAYGAGVLHVPMPQLAPVGEVATDLVAEAARYLNVPYLWGGNSGFGIDCSGLVQAACLACGLDCPGDSDQQAAGLGQALPEDAALQRGDLVFWKGHVGWVTGDGRLLHANAHHMAVAYEPLEEAITRIAASGLPVTGRRRVLVL